VEEMLDFVSKIENGKLTRDEARMVRKEKLGIKVKPRNYTHKYVGREKTFTLNISFNKSDVTSLEVKESLLEALEDIKL
jgi:hypothetical protein